MKKLSNHFLFVFGLTLGVFAVCFMLSFSVSAFADNAALYKSSGGANSPPAAYPKLADNLRAQLYEDVIIPFGFDQADNPFRDDATIKGAPSSSSSITVSKVGNSEYGGNSPGIPKIPSSAMINNTFPQSVDQTRINAKTELISPANNDGSEDIVKDYSDNLFNLRSDGAELYTIESVRPIGIARKSSNKKNVPDKRIIIFYSPLTGETFSAQPGTKFKDGFVQEISKDGVIFRNNTGEMVLVRWSEGKLGGKDKVIQGAPKLDLSPIRQTVPSSVPVIREKQTAP